MAAPRNRTIGERVFRALLRLLPADFRSDFADAMLADTERADTRWWREAAGVVGATVREHADAFRHDLKYAIRTMRRTLGFSALAVVMLSLGTGANVAVFSVIDAVLLRAELPDADRVVSVLAQTPDGKTVTNSIPRAEVGALEQAPIFSAVSASTGSLAILRGVAEPHRLDIECVSAGYFEIASVRPLIGRVFTRDEDRAGAPPVVVLGYQTWQREFGGDPTVIGRSIALGKSPSTVIGVMPREFIGPRARNRTAGWAPFAPAASGSSAIGCVAGAATNVIARLRPPYTRSTAAAAVNAMGLVPRKLEFERADGIMMDGVRTPLLVLLGAVACVLLIACANVANLQIERLVGRRRELAVRRALGASRGRIIRQTLTESLLLSLLGAAGGVLVAELGLSAIVQMIPATVPHVADIQLNGRALAIALGCSALVVLFIGLMPAWQTTSDDMQDHLRSSRGIAGGAQWLRRALVIVEVALSVVLLVGAGLLVRTFLLLRPDAPGFSTSGRVVAQVLLSGGWRDDPARLALIDRMIDGARSIPGVEDASASSYLPMSGVTDMASVRHDDTTSRFWASWVTAKFFGDLNIPVVKGRGFLESDRAGSQPVAAINETAARRFWPNRDPIGAIVAVTTPDGRTAERVIVGVVGDTRSGGLSLNRQSELFVPFAQQSGSTLIYLIARTNQSSTGTLAGQIRSIVDSASPGQVVDSVEPLQAKLDRAVSRPRFGAWLFGIFASVAAGLAVLGLGTVVAWWVTQRRREIGVRMALGATKSQVVGLVVRQGVALTAIGVGIGCLAAGLASSLLSDWIYGVTRLDPATFGTVAAGMLTVAVAAAYLPARRAARIDPSTTLRAE
jgi:putative ABC transport system permease protein